MDRNSVKMTPAELLAALDDPGYATHTEPRWVYTTVTPEVARALLDRYIDPPRRRLNQNWVVGLALRLQDPDPEGGRYEDVSVREDGKTIAGQHLLYAVLKADTPAEPVWVVLNSDDPFTDGAA